jgi:hypothetical protein
MVRFNGNRENLGLSIHTGEVALGITALHWSLNRLYRYPPERSFCGTPKRKSLLCSTPAINCFTHLQIHTTLMLRKVYWGQAYGRKIICCANCCGATNGSYTCSDTPNQVYSIGGVCWKRSICLAHLLRTLRGFQPYPVSVKDPP